MKDKPDSGFIYVIQMEGHPLYKIGRSSNVPRRMSEIGVQLPFRYHFCFAHRVSNSHFTESDIHKHFQTARKNGEWFELPPSALAVIRNKLILIQTQDLIDRLLYKVAGDRWYYRSDDLAKIGRVLVGLSQRLNRLIYNENQCHIAYEREVAASDILASEFVG